MKYRLGLIATVVTLGLASTAVWAHNHDRQQAERLQSLGEVQPLQTVLAKVSKDFPGQVLEVEFEDDADCHDHDDKEERRHSRKQDTSSNADSSKPVSSPTATPDGAKTCAPEWVYEFKILQAKGQMTKVKVNARNGEVIWSGQRPLRHRSPHS